MRKKLTITLAISVFAIFFLGSIPEKVSASCSNVSSTAQAAPGDTYLHTFLFCSGYPGIPVSISLTLPNQTITAPVNQIDPNRWEASFTIPSNATPGTYNPQITYDSGFVSTSSPLEISGSSSGSSGSSSSTPDTGFTGAECPDTETYIGVLDKCLNFGEVISSGLNLAIILGAMLTLIRFAIGAIQMVTSTGEPQKLQNARETLTDAILGFILLVSAWVLFSTLSQTLPPEWGIELLDIIP